MKKRNGLKVSAGIKAGGHGFQHNRRVTGLKVRAAIKAGGYGFQHNRIALG